MKTKLKNIASVQMGYSFRSRIEPNELGNIAIIQMKDLLDDNRVDCFGLVKAKIDDLKEHHFVKEADLIFRSRGQSSTSAIFKGNVTAAVVSAPLLRIRIKDKNILPEYLNWFINQEPSQTFLTSRAKGTAQKMISKETLEELEVIVPLPETQKFIVELAALAEEEHRLLEKLSQKRRLYIEKKLLKLTQGE